MNSGAETGVIDQLAIELNLKADKLLSEIKGVKDRINTGLASPVKATFEGLNKAAGAVTPSINQISNSLLDMARSFMAPLAGAMALKSAFSSYISEADNLGKLSKELKINMSDLQAWGGAVKAAGGSAEGFQGTIKGLQGKLDQAKITGHVGNMQGLYQMGVSAYNSAEKRVKTPVELLKDLASVAEKMDSDRFRIRAQSLGIDEGTIQLLQGGTKALDDVLKRQKSLGLYTKEDAEIARKFKTALDDTSQVFKSIAAVVLRIVLPPIQMIADKFNNLMAIVQEHDRFIKIFAATVTGIMIPALINFAAAAAPLLLIAGLISAVSLAIDDLVGYANGEEAAFGGIWESIFGSPENAAAALETVVAGLGKVKEGIQGFLEHSREMLIDLLKYIAELAGEAVHFWDRFEKGGFSEILASWKADFLAWWDSIMDYFREKFMGILPDWAYKLISGHSKKDAVEVGETKAEAQAAARETVLQGQTLEQAAQAKVDSGEAETIEGAQAQIKMELRVAEKAAGKAAEEKIVQELQDREKIISARRTWETNQANAAMFSMTDLAEEDEHISDEEALRQWEEGRARWVVQSKASGLGVSARVEPSAVDSSAAEPLVEAPQASASEALPVTVVQASTETNTDQSVTYNIGEVKVESVSDLQKQYPNKFTSPYQSYVGAVVSGSASGVNHK